MLWKVIFIVVYVKMGSYMTTHGKLHENGMVWHGMAWLGKAWQWNAMVCLSKA
jgi:hypothetical protein